MSDTTSLTNQFLIAMPALADPNFSHTVTYMCDHNEEGAMGLVINRPLDLDIEELFLHLDINNSRKERGYIPIYQGGPVQTERGFVLHRDIGDWEATLQVTDEIGLTMSQDIIEAIAHDEGPRDYLISLGYAGWGAGQLEDELAANAWLNGPADPSIIFDVPIEQRWTASAQQLGVELQNLSNDVGHA
ncbi:MAG: YqgE/AlgH family protein [Thioalkalispiraceae bacterium]|jgi:putative transcriptional regulator